MKIKNFTYLCGPMEQITVERMTGWRKDAASYLNERGIDVLDPTRRVSFHDQLVNGDMKLEDEVRTMNISKRIFKQDLEDVANSKVVLADVRRSSGKGTGTACELMFAHMKNKIIILWADKEDRPHPFIEAMGTEKHFSLAEALLAVRSYY